MLNHYVFFTINSNYNKTQKQEAINEIIEALKKLPEKIKQIRHYEIATNIKEGGSDIGLISKFDDLDSLEKYRKHQEHLKAVEIIKKHSQDSTFLDFQTAVSFFKK